MILTLLITAVIVGLSVLIHYEALYRISLFLNSRHARPRLGVVWGLLAAIGAHIIEVFIFATAFYGLLQTEKYGTLIGEFTHEFGDCVYYSFVIYTTLGFGDIIPTGPLRFLTGIESLAGLVLIAWTASFLYLQMQKLWGKAPQAK